MNQGLENFHMLCCQYLNYEYFTKNKIVCSNSKIFYLHLKNKIFSSYNLDYQ